MDKNIFYISNNNFNEKSHDLPNIYFKENFNKIKINKINNLIDFIKNNNNENNILLFYNQGNKDNKVLIINLMKYLKNTENQINIKIIIFTFDFWQTAEYYNNQISKEINDIKNFYILSFANIEKLNFYNNYNFKQNNYIKCFNTWCCYEKSFISFNNKPIQKILLSGAINPKLYPERFFIKDFNNIITYNYNKNDTKTNTNNYNLELNKYIGCFYSNIYIKKNNNDINFYNTKILLLKFYEILASGSLLVCSDEEIKLLKEYNLENKKHYYAINFKNNNNEIQKEIDFICDERNKKIINEIRYNGQIFAKNNLNSQSKFNQLMDILNHL